MNRTENKLGRKILINYTLTFCMVYLSGAISQFVDGIVVSRFLGEKAMAAMGISVPVFFFIPMLSGLVGMGVQACCAKAMGAGDRKRIEAIVSTGLWLGLGVAVVITLLGLCFLDPICHILGASESDLSLYAIVREYLKWIFAGAPAFIFTSILSPLVVLGSGKRYITASALTKAVINCVGDILAVTVFKSGITGIAMATMLDFYGEVFVLILYFFSKSSVFSLVPRKFDRGECKNILRLGAPKSTNQICLVLAPILINRIVLSVGGSSTMTVVSLQSSIYDILFIPGNAIAESVLLIMQVLRSENDREAISKMAISAVQLILIVMGSVALLAFAAAPLLLRIYLSPASSVFPAAVKAIRIFALYFLTNALNVSISAFIQSTGEAKLVQLRIFLCMLIIPIATMYVLGSLFGISGIFASYAVGGLLSILSYLIMAALHRTKGEKLADVLLLYSEAASPRREFMRESLLLLPPEDNATRFLEFTVCSKEDGAGISAQIDAFCRENGIDKRRSYFAALCVEELILNIITHGFSPDRKNICSARVLVKEKELSLRIEDDCPLFDLTERFKVMDKADVSANIGIKLVYGMAKSVQYLSVLGTNTVIISV